MNIQQYQPNHPDLVQHIAYFYRFSRSEALHPARFVHFPHFRNTINVYFDARIEISNLGRKIQHQAGSAPKAVVFSNRTQVQCADLIGPIHGFGIVFHPLGINHFIRKTLQDTPIEQAICPNELIDNLASIRVDESEQWLAKLETLLLNPFRVPKWNNLPAIVESILQDPSQCSVAELADQYFMNRRTLLRHFQKHLACPVSDFRSVVRFRLALDAFQQLEHKPSLTDLAHRSQYYDQSDFIHQFKAFAGGLPSKILNSITQMGREDMYWLLQSSEKLSH